MERLLLICVFLIFRIYAAVEENQTLIYHWDVHHEMNYYCQFGTDEQIRTHDNFEIQCYRRNKGMQYVSSDGVKFYPFLAYGSPIGFVLNCTDIPGGDLHNCNKYIYSHCNYSCKGSKVTREIQCVLKGPKENVRAQWSISQPCTDNISDPVHGISQKDSDQDQSQPGQLPTNMDVQYTTSNQENYEDSKSLVIAGSSVAAAAVVFILAVIGIIVYRRKYRRKAGILQKDSNQDPPKPGPTNIDVQYRNPTSNRDPSPEDCLLIPLSRENYAYTVPSQNGNGIFVAEGGGENTSPQADGIAEIPLIDQNDAYHTGTSPVKEEDAPQRSGTDAVKYPDGYGMAILLDNYNWPQLEPCRDNYKNMQDILKDGTDRCIIEEMKYWKNSDLSDLQSLEIKSQREDENFGNQRSGDSPGYNQCISTVKLLNSQTYSYRIQLAIALEAHSSRSREQTLVNFIEQHKEEFGFPSLETIRYIEKKCEGGGMGTEMAANIFLQRLSELGVKLGRIVEHMDARSNFKAVHLILEVHRDCPFCEKFRR